MRCLISGISIGGIRFAISNGIKYPGRRIVPFRRITATMSRDPGMANATRAIATMSRLIIQANIAPQSIVKSIITPVRVAISEYVFTVSLLLFLIVAWVDIFIFMPVETSRLAGLIGKE